MPQQAWSGKRERQYEHVKESARERGASTKRAKEIAARTVNKERARSGEARQSSRLSGLGVDVDSLKAEVRAEIDAAAEEALAAPMPDPSTALDGVLCTGEAEPLGDGRAPWSGFAS